MFYMFLAYILVAVPLAAAVTPTNKTERFQHKEIHADELKSWYDHNKNMIVLDARTKPYFDGTLLPKATWLPSDSTETEIYAVIPTKNSLIVVYCAGVKCPASGRLYDKLSSLGYTNVYEYHEGLEDWMDKGYPTTTQ